MRVWVGYPINIMWNNK